MLGIMNGLRQLLYYLLNKASLFANMSRSHHHSYSQLITNLTNVFAGFLYPTMHQTQANLSKKWLQSQTKNQVNSPRSGMGVASLFDNWSFPNTRNRANPSSVEAAQEMAWIERYISCAVISPLLIQLKYE